MKRAFSIIGVILLTVSMVFITSACESKRPKVTMVLEDGREMNFILYRNYAPETVAHFISLCESGYYDNTIISDKQSNRIMSGNYSYDKDLYLKPKNKIDSIYGEFSSNGHVVQNNPLLHELGVLSLFNEWGEKSSGSKNIGTETGSNLFFISTATNSSYDGRFATFGKIADDASLEILKDIMEDKTSTEDYPQKYTDLNEEYKITLPNTTIIIKTIKVVKQ